MRSSTPTGDYSLYRRSVSRKFCRRCDEVVEAVSGNRWTYHQCKACKRGCTISLDQAREEGLL